MLRIFSLAETIGSNSRRDHCPGMPNHHFRFPSVAKKRRLLELFNKGREGGTEGEISPNHFKNTQGDNIQQRLTMGNGGAKSLEHTFNIG